MPVSVLALVLLAAFIHASWNALLRGGADRFRTNALMTLSGALFALLCIPFLPLPAPASWPYILASGLTHFIYCLLLVRMYREGDLGHTYPIARGTSPLLVSLGGLLLAQERLSPAVILGIVLVSLGIFALSLGGHLRRGHFLTALLVGVTIAIYSVIDGLGVRHSGHAPSYTAWMVLLYGLMMPLFFLIVRRGRHVLPTSRRELLAGLGGGIISVVGYGIVIWAMGNAPMGPISALRETSVLFAILLGSLFLREKLTLQKLSAALLILTGAALLQLR